MHQRDLIHLAEDFFGSHLGLTEIETILGPRVASHMPQTVLSPRDKNVELAFLEPSNGTAEGEPFISGIALRFDRPEMLDLDEWVEKFGPYRIRPRLKPDQPIPYQFIVGNSMFNGYIVIERNDQGEDSQVLAQGVIMRRFPP